MAGLAAAWQLTQKGMGDIVVLEAEDMLASHSSARNAAIHMPLEESVAAINLAARSRSLIDERLGTSWISVNGMVYCTNDADGLDELRFWARQAGVFHQLWPDSKLRGHVPLLDKGPEYHALCLPLGGVMDIHRLTTYLASAAKARGARLVTEARVAQITVEGGRVTGCDLEDGQHIRSAKVVIANGAWAGSLGASVDCPLPLTPLKRHLAQLSDAPPGTSQMPVVWRLDDEVYLRPESGGLLASPCDEVPWEPELPTPDPEAMDILGGKLRRLSTRLEGCGVQQSWACLRTVAPDREPVVGADPRLEGLFWSAAFGGRGMTAGPAAGEVLACAVLGQDDPLAVTLQPGRLL